MTAPELKPCPFCRGTDTIILNGPVEDDWCAVSCDECHARGPINYTDRHAIAAWNTRADLSQAAIATAMMGAAEHLYQLMMDNSEEALQAQIDCLLADMTLDGNPNLAAYYRDKLIASIPSNATTALEAALMGAYKEGWSDGAANYHHDRNETPHEGWLISDTYKSIPTDASASRTHFEQERADHG